MDMQEFRLHQTANSEYSYSYDNCYNEYCNDIFPSANAHITNNYSEPEDIEEDNTTIFGQANSESGNESEEEDPWFYSSAINNSTSSVQTTHITEKNEASEVLHSNNNLSSISRATISSTTNYMRTQRNIRPLKQVCILLTDIR